MNAEPKRFSEAAMHSLLPHLLPDGADLCCTDLTSTDQEMTLSLHSTSPICPCPTCQQPSAQVRSRSTRTLTDLPWGSCSVRYSLTVRCFRCRNAACERHIFAERLPAVTQPAARRTTRARDELQSIGLALGGHAGAKRSAQRHLPTSATTTLLRLIRATPPPDPGTPVAVGDVLAALLRPAKQRNPLETQYLAHLQAATTDLTASFGLIQEFLAMVRDRTGVQVPAWLTRVAKQGCDALQRFANGLCDDLAAVQADLTEQWSNGVTEGHVNRLKLLKRQCYGRAGFATLRARVLYRRCGVRLGCAESVKHANRCTPIQAARKRAPWCC